MNVKELAEKLMHEQRARRLAAHSKTWTPSATPATSLGYECERRICYQRTRPDMASSISEELASIFEEGNMHQADVRRELSAIGYEVVEAEVNFKDKALDITGTIDGKIQLTGEHRARRIPLEIKSTQVSPPRTEEEWRASESSLLRRYYAQLQTYMFLTNEPEAIALFKEKGTGLWTCVAVALDFDYAEQLLKRAERVRDAVKLIEGAPVADRDLLYPARIADRSECDGCPFKDTVCHPADAEPDPLLMADEAKLVAQLEQRERDDAAATEFDKIDKAVKDRFKLTKGERFVVGGADGFLVVKKVSPKQTRITITRLNQSDAKAA
jgi:hypothetical protein